MEDNLHDYHGPRAWKNVPTCTVVMANGDKFEVTFPARGAIESMWRTAHGESSAKTLTIEYVRREMIIAIKNRCVISLLQISSVHGEEIERNSSDDPQYHAILDAMRGKR